MQTEETFLSANLEIDSYGYAHLKETAKWAKFLAIVGIILSSLLAVVGLFAGTLIRYLRIYETENTPAFNAGVLSFFYIVIAAFYLMTSLYLYRFAVKMQSALKFNDQVQLNASLSNQKIFYRILGIIMIVYLVIIALAILGMVAVIGTRME